MWEKGSLRERDRAKNLGSGVCGLIIQFDETIVRLVETQPPDFDLIAFALQNFLDKVNVWVGSFLKVLLIQGSFDLAVLQFKQIRYRIRYFEQF